MIFIWAMRLVCQTCPPDGPDGTGDSQPRTPRVGHWDAMVVQMPLRRTGSSGAERRRDARTAQFAFGGAGLSGFKVERARITGNVHRRVGAGCGAVMGLPCPAPPGSTR